MLDLPEPTTVKQLQAQMGLFNFYRCYVPSFSLIAKPLYELLKAGVQYIWTQQCRTAYNSIKQAFTVPGLALQLRDPNSAAAFVHRLVAAGHSSSAQSA